MVVNIVDLTRANFVKFTIIARIYFLKQLLIVPDIAPCNICLNRWVIIKYLKLQMAANLKPKYIKCIKI